MNFKRLLFLLVSLSILAAPGFSLQAGDVVPQTDAAVEATADAAAQAESGVATDAVPAEEGGAFDFVDAGAGKVVGWLSPSHCQAAPSRW